MTVNSQHNPQSYPGFYVLVSCVAICYCMKMVCNGILGIFSCLMVLKGNFRALGQALVSYPDP